MDVKDETPDVPNDDVPKHKEPDQDTGGLEGKTRSPAHGRVPQEVSKRVELLV